MLRKCFLCLQIFDIDKETPLIRTKAIINVNESSFTRDIESNKNGGDQSSLNINGTSIPVEDIIYIQSSGPSLEIHPIDSENPLILRATVKAFLSQHSANGFIQVHRSYLVNIPHIRVKFADKLILRNGKEIPISRSFKNSVEEVLINV